MSMLERAAIAAATAYDSPEFEQKAWLSVARAVLAEIREPSEGLTRAILDTEFDGNHADLAVREWHAAVDAILEGK